MSFRFLTIDQLDKLPLNEPLWVLNNATAFAGKLNNQVRPSDVLIDVRDLKTGRLSSETISGVVNSAVLAYGTPTSPDSEEARDRAVAAIRRTLDGEVTMQGSVRVTVTVPFDYRGFPFNCAEHTTREALLHSAEFRRAVANELILPVSTADAEWLIAKLAPMYEGVAEPDRHALFNNLIYGDDAEKEAGKLVFGDPVPRIVAMFEERDMLNARPWYVKLLSRLKGGA